MTEKTNLKSDDWFKSYGPMKYPLGSPLGAAILCILPSIHLMSKSTCGSCWSHTTKYSGHVGVTLKSGPQ